MNLGSIAVSSEHDSTVTPRVSVLMPCYNVEDTLDECMRSLVDQTLRDIEIVAVDDGSTDETLSMLQDWARKDSRIRVLAREHAGIIPALNAGWKACRSGYIARMDADDRSHLERMEKQAQFLDEHPDIALTASLVEGFPKEHLREGFRIYIAWLNSLVETEDLAREIFIESPLAHPSVMMRREWLENVDGYQDYGWPEDYDLWLRMHLAGARMQKVPEVLLYWREHPARLTRTDSRYAVEAFLKAKAHYLCEGPLQDSDAVIVWGSGQMGKRLSKHLIREGAKIIAFIDVDPGKIGRTRRGIPIYAPEALPEFLAREGNAFVLSAVGSRGARPKIRAHLNQLGLQEGKNWWCVA